MDKSNFLQLCFPSSLSATFPFHPSLLLHSIFLFHLFSLFHLFHFLSSLSLLLFLPHYSFTTFSSSLTTSPPSLFLTQNKSTVSSLVIVSFPTLQFLTSRTFVAACRDCLVVVTSRRSWVNLLRDS